ncbi:MAG: OmpA family protein [Thermodesulfobacteriota bacterium]
MKKIPAFISIISLSLLTVLSGCASTTTQSAIQQTVSMENTINEISELESEMDQARQKQIDVLSPGSFAKAEASFNKAKNGAEKGKQISSILENATDARGHLDDAKENAKVARTMLPQVIESRRMAHLAGAAKLEKEFANVEGQFLKLTEAIEKNNINYTKKNDAKVDEAYRRLELMAIKNETIGEARKVLSKAEKNDAKKYAPRSFNVAQKRLSETDKFITNNRYDKDRMQVMAKESLFYANRALVLTSQSKSLDKLNPEEKLLWTEDFISKITTQLVARDSRDQHMGDQVGNILLSIGALQNNNKQTSKKLVFTQQELAETKAALAVLEAKSLEDQKDKEVLLADQKARETQMMKEKKQIQAEQAETARKLEEERKFSQKFIEIQHAFGADEADVYKRGNQLIIQLKGIQFPSGNAIIIPENFQLLSKVQEAIKTFDDPSVVVEGHTDSIGDNESNQKLSQKRAKAVRDYLIANKTIADDKIISQGYGSSRPLASNKTLEGRAMNRRIDVIITPGTVPSQ